MPTNFAIPPLSTHPSALTPSGLRTHSAFLLPLLPRLLQNLHSYQLLNPSKSLSVVVTASHNPWWDAGVKIFIDGHSPTLEEISYLNGVPSRGSKKQGGDGGRPLLVFWDTRFSSIHHARCTVLLYPGRAVPIGVRTTPAACWAAGEGRFREEVRDEAMTLYEQLPPLRHASHVAGRFSSSSLSFSRRWSLSRR